MKKKIATNNQKILLLSRTNQQLGTFLTLYEHRLTIQQIEFLAKLQAALCLEIVLLNNYGQRKLYMSSLSLFIRYVTIPIETIVTKEIGYFLNRENLNLYNISSTIVNTYRSILEREREKESNKRRTR